jgi:hypothetical protein
MTHTRIAIISMKVKTEPYPKHRWYHNFLYEKFGYTPEQKISVHIDPWDTWSMDHTLADIVLPMLIQLRDTAHGSHMVDDEDVPHLAKRGHSSNESVQWDLFASDEHDELVWEHCHTRWQWLLNEMIYAFDCKANKEDVYMRFDDMAEARKEQDRIANGFRLFGKYYEGLWD